MPAYLLVLGLLTVALAGGLGYALGRASAGRAAVDAETVDAVRREIVGLRALVATLKDTAWDHRELDSPLATIVIDEIRAYEKKELEP